MKRNLNIIVPCLLCLFVTVPAIAGMKVSLQNGTWGTTNGGEFLITVEEGPIGIYPKNATFESFCIETNEYINSSTVYNVTSDTAAWDGGSGGPEPDPLSPESAYLYSLWLDGTDGVNTIIHSDLTANALQRAIWELEDEDLGEDAGLSATYIDWAEEAVTSAGDNDSWFDDWGYTIGDIRVMNLWDYSNICDPHAQDQLVRVPIPGAVLLGMLGLGAAGMKLRRFA